MQNYSQQPQGFQRPGSTTAFAGQPGQSPAYGAPQGYQSPTPSIQSQWAPPAQNTHNTPPVQQQWNQSPQQTWTQPPPAQQQGTGGYNPGTYGVIGGGYTQNQTSNMSPQDSTSSHRFSQSYPTQYQSQQQDVPPPPPPKPIQGGFAGAVQQQQQQQQQYAQQQQQQQPQQAQQSWQQQQPGFGTQQGSHNFQSPPQNTGFAQQPQQQAGFGQQAQQGGFKQTQQSSFPGQNTSQQPHYNATAPPPPSDTPGGSYFPPSQGRPQSLYGADQANQFASPPSGQPPNTVLSPDEQHPAYIPPSLSGQGVQSYMPTNTNPMPGVYVPPPPDIPAWQQAQHAPLQAGKSKFRYTKPTLQPGMQSQVTSGFPGGMVMQQAAQQMQQPIQQQMQPPVQQQQSVQQQPQFGQQFQQQSPQAQQQFGPPLQTQFQQQGQMQSQGQFGQQMQPQPQAQFTQPVQQPIQQDQFQHQPPQTVQQQAQYHQPQQIPQQYNQSPQAGQMQQPVQQFQTAAGSGQWNISPPAQQGYGQPQPQAAPAPYGMQQTVNQQGWQPGHATQDSVAGQGFAHGGQEQVIQAPKPINGQSQTTPPSFVNATEPSPKSPPVSPVQQRQSVSFDSGNSAAFGRTDSIGGPKKPLGVLGRRHLLSEMRTGSVPPAAPTPPVPSTAASALGAGGPSDWEHFGSAEDEIDDTELFGAKKDEKDEPQHLDSVELPVHPSPPSSVHEWPTPPPTGAALDTTRDGRDTYAPTPPLKPTDMPASSQPQQFVINEDTAVSQSLQSVQTNQPPAQNTFVMDAGGWVPPKENIAPKVQQHHQAVLSAGNTFVMNDGRWAPLTKGSATGPIETQQPATGLVMEDGGWSDALQTPTQRTGGGVSLIQGPDHAAELKAKDEAYAALQADVRAKDEAYGRLQAVSEKEKAELRAQIEKGQAELQAEIASAKAETDAAKSRAESDMRDWSHQIEQLKADVAQIKMDTSTKEQDLKERDGTIERLKEDIEGQGKTIAEQDATIQDLRKQLQNIPPPNPGDLIPDLDPWYAGSLERFIAMLRQEATEPLVEEKIKVFTGFLAAESHARGLEYYSAPPALPAVSPATVLEHSVEHGSAAVSRVSSIKSYKRQDIHITPSPQPAVTEDAEYSPGGRPVMKSKATIKSNESVPTEHSFIVSSGPEDLPHHGLPKSGTPVNAAARNFPGGATNEPSSQSTTILTPTSSIIGDDYSTIVQFPPEQPAEPPKPQYQPYIPGKLDHRQSMSFSSSAFQSPPVKHDEIFFEATKSQPMSQPESRPDTSTSAAEDMPVPEPLFGLPTQAKAKQPEKPREVKLADLLPEHISPPKPNLHLEELLKEAQALPADFGFITSVTQAWEKTAAQTRAKHERDRQQRQEESETRATQLFNDHEIAYADIGDIEDEFKAQERELKAQEDRDEYKTYVKEVFDKVYDGLQDEIKTLMEIFVEVEDLLADSVCGKDALENTDPDCPDIVQCMEVLRKVHDLVELRHEKVAQAVAERDRRYKKTEIQPLYAAGNIAKMKSVERHFENAEKQAVLRAKTARSDRVANVFRTCEEAVVRAVGVEKALCDKILAALKAVDEDEADLEVVGRAGATFIAVKTTSKHLLTLLNGLELELNFAVREADMAQARVDGDEEGGRELLEEMKKGDKKLRDEFQRRVSVLDADVKEVLAACGELGLPAAGSQSEEAQKEKRMQAALEAAKKRNGRA